MEIFEDQREPNKMKINFKIDKEINFLMILYQIIKNQSSFDNLKLNEISILNKEDKEYIKRIIREKKDIISSIRQNKKLNLIYNKNKDFWEDYWNKNLIKLKVLQRQFKDISSQYDFSIFKKVEDFFEFNGPREIDFYLCIGNESSTGTGNALSPNLVFIFPRQFKNYSIKQLNADFAVLIHEIMHLHQDMCREEDKLLREEVARCFAPRGILINEEKFKGNFVFYNLLRESFENRKKYKDIRNDLFNELYSKEKCKEVQK